jgi:hypothetical protein
MLNPNIKLILNNNPVCEAQLESTVKQQVWKINNKPFIVIEGNGFKDGTTNIRVEDREDDLFNGNIKITNGVFSIKYELDKILNDLEKLEVIVGDYSFIETINLKKLHGTVKYFDGRPVKNPIISCTYSKIIAIGDEFGNFELLLSSPEKEIAVFDKTYSKDTLEAWIYNVDLHVDTELDIKIDKAEVYGINMWRQYASDYIHFIPMSLSRTKEVMKKGFKNEMDIASCEEMWCKISKEDIEVYSNNELLDILSFTEVKDFIGYKDENPIYRNGYVVSIPKGVEKRRIIKIVLKSRLILNKEEIVDMGEGYYIML